jgi:hypothetical protein
LPGSVVPKMLVAAKRIAHHILGRAGYRLVKSPEYDSLVAAAGHRRFTARSSAGSAGTDSLTEERRQVLRSAVRYLLAERICGDIVDCGYGDPATLAAAAAILCELGDITRRLVLFDSSADPAHRAELELKPWGINREWLSGSTLARLPPTPEPPPEELAASGYPAGNISILRYPREPIVCAGPIAFLGLTAETYEANRACIAAFFPLMAPGGVIAIDDGGMGRSNGNAVDEYLTARGLVLNPFGAAKDYRVGTTPKATG